MVKIAQEILFGYNFLMVPEKHKICWLQISRPGLQPTHPAGKPAIKLFLTVHPRPSHLCNKCVMMTEMKILFFNPAHFK